MTHHPKIRITAALRREAAAYYNLCDRARQLGVTVALDDPRAARTVAGLASAVARSEGR